MFTNAFVILRNTFGNLNNNNLDIKYRLAILHSVLQPVLHWKRRRAVAVWGQQ